MKSKLLTGFKALYSQSENPDVFFAPGRINLIGEHTDYNGGLVMPCAIDIGTYLAIAKRRDDKINLYSANFPDEGIRSFTLNSTYQKCNCWTDYLLGVLHVLSTQNKIISQGFDLYVEGNLPNGAGLSSSASLELVFVTALSALYDLELSTLDRVKLSQKTENSFIGISSGIMDQFAVAFGKKDYAIKLNTSSLQYEYAPLVLNGGTLIIANTNKRRTLADSKYNERFEECKRALVLFKQVFKKKITTLCDLSSDAIECFPLSNKTELLLKRARHVISENERVKRAHQAMLAGDLKTFGFLMNASHASLKVDYEVTGKELDTLVALAQRQKGVLGSRMTGAGFGGCTITLIQRECIDDFVQELTSQYTKVIGYPPTFYTVNIDDGARQI